MLEFTRLKTKLLANKNVQVENCTDIILGWLAELRANYVKIRAAKQKFQQNRKQYIYCMNPTRLHQDTEKIKCLKMHVKPLRFLPFLTRLVFIRLKMDKRLMNRFCIH